MINNLREIRYAIDRGQSQYFIMLIFIPTRFRERYPESFFDNPKIDIYCIFKNKFFKKNFKKISKTSFSAKNDQFLRHSTLKTRPPCTSLMLFISDHETSI